MHTSKSKSDLPITQLDSIRSLQAMILAIVIGEGSLICLPFIVGGIVERYELAEGAAGIITSLQFATMGLVSIAIFNIVHKIDRRRWLLIAAGFILLGHALAMLSSSWTIFLIGRVFTGLGEGTALSIGNASAAGTRRPQLTYSILAITMVVTASVIYLFMPLLAEKTGSIAVFYVLTGLVLVAMPFLFAMPGHALAKDDGAHSEGIKWWPFPRLLVGIGCLFAGANTLWAYAERIGFSIGLKMDTIVTAFLATVILSVIGPVLANFTEKRWGYRFPVLAAAVVAGSANFMLATADFQATFFAGIIIANIAYLFLMPYYRSLTAFVDPLGRLAVGSVVMQTVGAALAPSMAGAILLLGGGYTGIGFLSLMLIICSCLLVWKVAGKADVARG